MLLELFCEDRVLTGEVVSQGQKVVTSCFLRLALSLDSFPVALDVFGEEILATNLIEIAKMVDAFLGMESYFVEGVGDELFFAPVDVPVIIFGLTIVAMEHGFLDAIGEESLELDIVAISIQPY